MPPQQEVGQLLRTRRESLQPAEVGIVAGGRRRARGLRREEVAALASISPTYYTFLEQGRDVRPSVQVLDALARALRLTPTERTHLHQLVHGEPGPPAQQTETVPAQLAALVERLNPMPAYVTGRRFDVLAANQAARLVWTDWEQLPPGDRNILWFLFTDPDARDRFVDWEAEAAPMLGRLRLVSAQHPDDPSFAELVDRLHAASAEVREWWPRHQVAPLTSSAKRMRHPILGEFDVQQMVLQLVDDPDVKLVTLTVDAPTAAGMAQLIHV